MKKITCSLLLILFSGVLHSRPLYIEFYKMMERSTQVFIGTYIGVKDSGSFDNTNYLPMSYLLHVETSLKGSWKSGDRVVDRATGGIYFRKGDRFIAFINEQNGFEWVGLPVDQEATEISENTLLKLEGFYDFNAYIVGPSTVTLRQLKQYIEEKKYDVTISGHLHCFSNQTLKMEKQDVQIDVVYAYKGKEEGTTDIKVNGMSWYHFPKKPYLSLGSWESEIDLKFELSKYRSLTVVGKLDGKNQSDVINAYFWVQEPRELTFDELKEFITNDNYENPYYELELKTEKNGTYIIELDKESGRIGYIKAYHGRDLTICSIQDRDDYGRERHIAANLDVNSKLYLLLDSTEITQEELEFTYGDLIRQMKMEGSKGKMVIRSESEGNKDRYIDDFILTYKRTLFAHLYDDK
jgi:RNA binding exosome subunit